MFTEAQQAAIVRTELDSVFRQSFDGLSQPGLATADTADIFKPINTEHAFYIFQVFKGVGYVPQIGETQTVPTDTPKVGYKTTVPILDYGKSIPLSKNLFDDNLHGVWSMTVAQSASTLRQTQTQNAFALFNGAFTTTLTADASAAVGNHTLLNGQVISNQLTTTNTGTGTTTLTFDNFNAAVTLMLSQVDQAGVIMQNLPRTLLVPTNLFTTATQLTESALVPFSAENSLNVFRSNYGITVYHSPFLTSTTAWFLIANNHSITRLVRQGVQTFMRDWGYSDNRTYVYQFNFREAYFIGDYAGLIGATGNP